MKIELLNSEGPILTAIKIAENVDQFRIVDQYKKEKIFSRKELVDFIQGEIEFIDSKNKIWHYPSESSGMKRSDLEIKTFLNT